MFLIDFGMARCREWIDDEKEWERAVSEEKDDLRSRLGWWKIPSKDEATFRPERRRKRGECSSSSEEEEDNDQVKKKKKV